MPVVVGSGPIFDAGPRAVLLQTRDAASPRDLELTPLQDMPAVLTTTTELIFDEMTAALATRSSSPD